MPEPTPEQQVASIREWVAINTTLQQTTDRILAQLPPSPNVEIAQAVNNCIAHVVNDLNTLLAGGELDITIAEFIMPEDGA